MHHFSSLIPCTEPGHRNVRGIFIENNPRELIEVLLLSASKNPLN